MLKVEEEEVEEVEACVALCWIGCNGIDAWL